MNLKKVKFIVLALILLSSFIAAQNTTPSDGGTESTTLKLSDDIGVMADRIGDMSDRILKMADKIVETQELQSDNFTKTQENILSAINAVNSQLEQNNTIIENLIQTNNKLIECMCPETN